ncbi:molybdopterin molybdotransferase [Selenomonas ruminantium]|uniref:Molybdopterin molybdenumtransferase n=1 Tax=Selenomonas ruminantium TaxID=971 RepID=A0A1M6UQ61_SELRU|nr:molybdopterin molybdotransferase MoeA [Selenomonas ruminantium]SHK71311.1 molybdopterin molybdotransferase [Selenomonas ruminantium]
MQDLSLEKAVELLKEHCHRVTAVEEVPLLSALGKILAEDYVAAFDNPPFDRSPLDGYTFAAERTQGHDAANPAMFQIIGEECAGDFFDQPVPEGSALRIMTGGAIPKGCNCVVRQEDVKAEGDTLTVPFSIAPYTNYCYAGEDIKQGTKLAKKGTKLTAAHIGVLASMGFATVKVLCNVRVAIASTGDELLQPGQPLAPGKIYNSNLYLLASRLQELGFKPEIVGILPDEVDEAAKIIAGYKDRVDVFLTTGGVSVGKKDIMHGVVEQVGNRLFWRVSMKPGGPALAYTMGETLGIALSGNPFAAYATFELIAVPVLAHISGNEKILPERMQAVLTDAFPKESRGRRFIRAYHENGKVRLPEQHASGSLFSVVGCNAFVDIPAGTGKLAKETEVDIVRLYRVK